MMKQALALTVLSLLSATASADHPRGYNPRESAGVWTGIGSGTFQGQPYASITRVTISHDGQSATVDDDATIGPSASSCTLTSYTEFGTAIVHCRFTAGVATGAEYDVHYSFTDAGQHLKVWVSNPALTVTTDLTRP